MLTMSNDNLFQQKVQRIGRLIPGLNDIADNHARATAQELVQLVMELHGIALERMKEVILGQSGCGAEIIGKLGRDRMVSSLFVLHGLHPDDVETRVARAVESLAEVLRKQEVELQLVAVSPESASLRVRTSGHVCGSTYSRVRAAIEEAVYEAAPEISSLTIDGLEGKDAAGFVDLSQLLGTAAPSGPLTAKGGD
jgi:hypothetical protein